MERRSSLYALESSDSIEDAGKGQRGVAPAEEQSRFIDASELLRAAT